MLLLRCHLLEVGNQVGDLLFLLEADEFHLIARDVTLRGGNVSRQRLLVPGDADSFMASEYLKPSTLPAGRPKIPTRVGPTLFFSSSAT
jgi:hypothetical protein